MSYLTNAVGYMGYGLERRPYMTTFGETAVANRRFDVIQQFNYNINPRTVRSTFTGTAAATVTDSMLVVTSGTTANSEALLQTVENLKYYPGSDVMALWTATFTTGTPAASSIQRAGLFNVDNGFFCGFEQSSTFSITRRVGGVDNTTTVFNMDQLDGSGPSGITLDHSKVNLYRVTYAWLGIAPIIFWVYGGQDKGWVPFHKIDLGNQITGMTIYNPSLPFTAYVKNTSTANIQLKIGCFSGSIMVDSRNNLNSVLNAVEGIRTVPANTNGHVLSVRARSTFGGMTNTIKSIITGLGVSVDTGSSVKAVKVGVYRNSTFDTALTWANVSTNESTVEYSTTAATLTSGLLQFTSGTPGNGGFFYPLRLEMNAQTPADIYSVVVFSSSSCNSTVSLNWEEQF